MRPLFFGLVTAVLALSLTACSSSTVADDGSVATAPAQSTEGMDQSPSKDQASEEVVAPEMPAAISRLDGVSFEDFAKTPRDDQLTYANHLEGTEYANAYEDIYGTDEWYTNLTPASADNSDREILDNLNHTIQIAQMTPKDHTFTGEDGGEYSQLYDPTQGKKVLSGAFTENKPEVGYPGFIQEGLDMRGDGIFAAANVVAPQFTIEDPNFTGSNFECMDEVTQTNEVCRSFDIIETSKTGSLRVILTPFKDAVTGAQEFRWLAVDR
ncbi:hypothetical protein E3T37_16145 [Cryobacterium sp. TMT2-10]|uniref:hypothetical protein n=1 Tax=Cryobacterium sp. TMT2-10 TaxID=1259244 RepID=UPI00106BC75E|nr:hypothetical protein [Cryobacterium sp. TMT2-10]TFD34986.1 hypothetical protein E3T37_16145 [Cryobacterium sp. TMT2-10]